MLIRARDLFMQLIHDVLPVALPLCIVVAAAVLWRRTRRISALVQLIASVLLLYGMIVDRYGWHSTGLDRVYSQPLQISRDIALFLGVVSFPCGYLVYALTKRRI